MPIVGNEQRHSEGGKPAVWSVDARNHTKYVSENGDSGGGAG